VGVDKNIPFLNIYIYKTLDKYLSVVDAILSGFLYDENNECNWGGWAVSKEFTEAGERTAPQDVSSNYINRDLSWMEFNRRVLEEAQDESTPLLERMKFLSIVSTNFDEFMSVRVAGIRDLLKAGIRKPDFTGYTPRGLFDKVMRQAQKIVREQSKTHRELERLLAKEDLWFVDYDDLNATQKRHMDDYFHRTVYPVLTPMAVDQSRPFPLVQSLGLYLAIVLRREGDDEASEPFFALMQVPSNLKRVLAVPERINSSKKEFLLLEQLIMHHIEVLFADYKLVAAHAFRITRNADLTLNEEGAEDLLEEIENQLKLRRWGTPIRLEVAEGMHPFALDWLKEEFEIEDHIFTIDGPLDLSYWMKFAVTLPAFDHLRYSRIESVYPREFEDCEELYEVIREKDVLLYHPYESFEAVNDFICDAAKDPNVLAIKMMLYRVSGDSKIVRALAEAAEAGKQVTVVVELKARFDEERNIAWARQLERSGCHVVYGLVGLKIHAKLVLIVRQEGEGVRRYVHVSTGNYNDSTARFYTDLGLFTADSAIGEDASSLFNEVTGYSAPRTWKQVAVAPDGLMKRFIELIRREKEHAQNGKTAYIIAKMNSLSNKEMIDELYAASQAGVKIDLIVRGVCCLRPQVPGLSENITVRSIVDRFLEHARLYYFDNGGQSEVFLSSADWMTRNLTRRIELLTPVLDRSLHHTLIEILRLNLNDNVKARYLQANGLYTRVSNKLISLRSQFAAGNIKNWKK
jgi:polyphosphate kinase